MNKNATETPGAHILECVNCGHPNVVANINRFICPECGTAHTRVGGASWVGGSEESLLPLIGQCITAVVVLAIILALGVGMIATSVGWWVKLLSQ